MHLPVAKPKLVVLAPEGCHEALWDGDFDVDRTVITHNFFCIGWKEVGRNNHQCVAPNSSADLLYWIASCTLEAPELIITYKDLCTIEDSLTLVKFVSFRRSH